MKKIVIFISLVAAFFALASFAHAQDYTPLAPLPGTFTGVTGSETTTLSIYLSGMLKLIIALGAGVSILVAIIGGTQYVAAGIAPSAKQDAKERIWNSLIGLTLILTSWLILNSINPNLVKFELDLPPIAAIPGTGGTPPSPTTPTYKIISSAGSGGSITPEDRISVAKNASQSYLIEPDSGYSIKKLSIDGSEVAILTAYTFNNVTANHSIRATFSLLTSHLTISASAGANGKITPAGNTVVGYGSSKTYTITPSAGYSISSVSVDGVNRGAISSYTFSNVITNRTISATFIADPNSIPAGMDLNNDYSIILKCVGNTTYISCPKTDLNGDGKTDATDVSIFLTKGSAFDTNKNKTVELDDLAPPVSCFFKISTANIKPILPLQQDSDAPSDCGSKGKTLMPTVLCNGATWLKSPVLVSACAPVATPLERGYGTTNQYDKFEELITNASSGSVVNLTSLFRESFFDGATYKETDTGKITYATIAQYDLNNDGYADFSASGADMASFNSCKGQAISSACAQADFNGDGFINERDVAVGGTVQSPYYFKSIADLINRYLFKVDFGGGFAVQHFTPLGWNIGDFESNFFDSTGYSDKQIIKYCIDHKAWFGCGVANVDGSSLTGGGITIVDNADLTAFNNGAPLLNFNSDGVVNLQ